MSQSECALVLFSPKETCLFSFSQYDLTKKELDLPWKTDLFFFFETTKQRQGVFEVVLACDLLSFWVRFMFLAHLIGAQNPGAQVWEISGLLKPPPSCQTKSHVFLGAPLKIIRTISTFRTRPDSPHYMTLSIRLLCGERGNSLVDF